MTEVLTDEIIGKYAMTSGGYPIGSIEDLVIDTETGELKYLLVRPASSNMSNQKTDGRGRTVVTINSIKISGDNVIIS